MSWILHLEYYMIDFGDWLELRKKTILRSGNLIKNKIDSGSLVGGKQNRINRVGYWSMKSIGTFKDSFTNETKGTPLQKIVVDICRYRWLKKCTQLQMFGKGQRVL